MIVKVKPPHTNKESLPQKLVRLSKDELLQRDVLGRTILHVIVLCNRYDLLRHLLKNPFIKHIFLFIDYESGWNVLHYVVFYRRMQCLKCLQDYFRSDASGMTFGDLLRCKDRNRLTPMQLIHNNYKDLMLVPTCINETNEFELEKRIRRHRLVNEYDEPTNSWWCDARGGSEVYVFGANNNNNLGVGDTSDRIAPTRLSHKFFKANMTSHIHNFNCLPMPRYKEFRVSKYHSVLITRNRNVYTCGIGSYGRLGHSRGNLANQYNFKLVEDLKAETVAVSNNHTVVLGVDGGVYGWGANNYYQLGVIGPGNESRGGSLVDFPNAFEATPIHINTGELKNGGVLRRNPIKGVSVSKIHSLVYTDYEVYSWGLSIGQMGFSTDSSRTIDFRYKDETYKGQFQSKPKAISFRDEIKLVETCETCTCVITVLNDIHVLYNYQHIKLPKIPVKASDKQFDFFKPAVLTRARQIVKVCFRDLGYIALLMDSGDVLGFDLTKDIKSIKYSSIWKPYNEDMNVVDLDISHDGSIILCTRDGSVFRKNNGSKLRQNSISGTTMTPTFINTVTNTKFKRLDGINKVVKVSCDANFTSFGFIRDSMDALPLKVHLNDFLIDFSHLSCTMMAPEDRKQDQLFKSDHDGGANFYIRDFAYPHDNFDDDNDEMMVDNKSKSLDDILLSSFKSKYDYSKNKPPTSLETYKRWSLASPYVIPVDLTYWEEVFNKASTTSYSGYDCFFEFQDYPTMRIGAHKSVFKVRSVLCKKLFLDQEGSLFDNGHVRLFYDSSDSTLRFESGINLKVFLMLIHYIYTNEVVVLADDSYDHLDISSSENSPEYKALKSDFDNMVYTFQIGVNTSHSSTQLFVEKFGPALLNVEDGDKDLIVKLSDGQIKCHTYILICRSAYFETLFSQRWHEENHNNNNNKTNELGLELENITCLQFETILRYLYGVCDAEVFNTVQSTVGNSFEFANFLLELMEIADQFLLLPLKTLCELALKDMITLDDVLVLTIHSDNLKAKKLFLNCAWILFDNLELLIFELSELSYTLLQKIEEQFEVLSKCRQSSSFDDLIKSKQHWFEDQGMVALFVNDVKGFNEIFMSDKKGYLSFKPLIDIKYDSKTNPPIDVQNKKRRSRKSSTRSSVNALNDLRNSLANDLVLERNHSENAIDDNDFETVVYGRRKSSSLKPIKQTSPPAAAIKLNLVSNIIVSSVGLKLTTSTGSVNLTNSSTPTQSSHDRFPSLGMAWKNGSTLSIGSSSGSPKATEVVAKGTTVVEEQRISETKTAINKKVLLKPIMRISQKQRKKLAQEANDETMASGFNQVPKAAASTPMAPWTAPNGGSGDYREKSVESSSTQRKLSLTLASLPMLGTTSKTTPTPTPTPSLTEIMLEESLRTEQQPVIQKTFLEIQQEEEFNRWWQEEAARVQREMGLNSEPKSTKKKNKKGSNKNHQEGDVKKRSRKPKNVTAK